MTNFWRPRISSKLLLLGPLRPSSRLTSTTQCSSVGSLKVLSFCGGTSSSIPLELTCRTWTSKKWTRRWRLMRLPSPRLQRVTPPRRPLLMTLLLMTPLLVTMLPSVIKFITYEGFSSHLFFFFGCPLCFGPFVNLISEQFLS